MVKLLRYIGDPAEGLKDCMLTPQTYDSDALPVAGLFHEEASHDFVEK